MKPTFINIGPGRSGTSWLFQMLSQHPQVCMSRIKETEFFNTNYHKGFQWYEKHFSNCRGAKAIGEISNNYYLSGEVAHRIRSYLPEAKIIINLRYPPSLLKSYINFGIRRGLDLSSIDNVLSIPIGKIMGSGYDYRLKQGTLTETDKVSLIDSVMLFDRLSQFFKIFKPEVMYPLIFERLKDEPELVAREIFQFINVDPNFIPSNVSEAVNSSIKPKFSILAVFAAKTAFLLRRLEAYRLLTALHKSESLKKLLFQKDTGSSEPILNCLNQHTILKLRTNSLNLMERYPALNKYWVR